MYRRNKPGDNMNYLDLFHGIGGFALGAYWAGMKFETHYCSDIEPYAQELYKLRFPDSIQLGDITKINTADLPAGDWIISGGFPCQDISIAGKGAGIHGTRSGLWFEYWRIINDLRPRYAIMENVGMLIHRGLREVLGSLAEIGYNAEWQDIRASDMGAPHKRERIWIVAYPESIGGGGFQGLKRHEETERIKSNNRKQHDRTFPDTDNTRLERGQDTGGITGSRQERKQQLERQSEYSGTDYWSVEPAVGRLVNGLPRRVDRLKGLGNAIVPQIAELLFRQIKELKLEEIRERKLFDGNKCLVNICDKKKCE